ncbi:MULTISPECIES: Ti-type conjugative transfer relaxase TraA [Rhizobium/Agrobacterium group]|uniref:ATP-dependent RecD-like DNA helicase n=4 Tax=Rhizobium/Agrobacterium group TaxID=227290 RepID=A8W094_RHIRH|nr:MULTISPECIES: Ti-type conjugative transfer relaxase TraA [Rhizobium/Agrobacterium group]NSX94249.1 Ti-type conjugative transfer relaxase TraA [Agrobacterium tumefaciens]ABW33634.1 rcorf77 [Rhizobium rhizogenes]AQS65456.1 Ti-type conjugative transfer relaxase TraA [Rhizobium rhizogenes]ASK42131.1 Ti-type conjugative transfer relaxase TraA [Rhizobium rhizogenes]MCZ7445624.1 Ti-type conjugative transfer relaxase TraA [Rhizobium rhizogenes]
MAVPHFSVSVVARGSGRSAVLSAAYRHCAKMEYEREARTIDYTRKLGLLHEEFVIPADSPEWVRSMIADRSVAGASEAFWNKVEAFEKRSDAQLAKDVTIALPLELTSEQNIALMRDFVERHITAKGMVADWVYHDAPGNPHVHLMTTLRPLTEDGFGSKKVAVLGRDGKPIRNDAGKIVYDLWAGSTEDFNAFRDGWFACQNKHLALAGLDIRIDGRSFEKQGIDLEPTIHLGVGAKAIERKAEQSDGKQETAPPKLERIELQEARRSENARRIQRRPEIVLELITREKSVFDERDVAKVLYRYIDDARLFQSLMVRILQSPEALRLERERMNLATGVRELAKYTTREMIRLEAEMANRAIWLSARASHGVREAVLQATFARHSRLSDEQRTAIEHVAGGERIAAVIGRAGAGKTTMMKAAREAWEAAGYRVVGIALAGKAAEGLEKEAGIPSRTLSSWELRWNQGRNQLDNKTVIVLDEAGMVSSRQMALLVETVTKAGAKLVLVGDPEQLQPIEAGAAFRAIAARIGYAELETIYRQRQQWMRDASLDLARGNIRKAVDAYTAHGRMIGLRLKDEAVESLIAAWDRDYDPSKTSLILAHLRRDVRMLNDMARAKLVERGVVAEGFAFKTEDGHRKFAPGDQIVFLKNEGSLGVKNGMLAKVLKAAPGRVVAEVGEGEHRRQVTIEQRFYNNLDHGYATTIHKSQGATVDRVKVLASLSLDRHLTYVAMTRHREDLAVYYGSRSFAKSGGLIPILSRRNAKETTLDYEQASFYRQALRFAEARGLHLMNVARAVARDRLEWTIRQKQKLVGLGARLAAIATKLGFVGNFKNSPIQNPIKEAKPMVSGITTFPKSFEQAVEDKLAADPGLKKQWEDVSTRFHLVYAQPEAAFKAINVDAMVKDQSVAKSTLAKVADAPESFGTLKGKPGLLASRAEKQDREKAIANVPALGRNLERYLRERAEAELKHETEERAVRLKVSVDIPALSPAAKQMLERVRDAIDRNDLPAGLEYALADKMVKAELEGFAKAVSERFGERTFLPLAAKDTNGKAFETVTAGMTAGQKAEVQSAWNSMRTVQQLAAHERTTEALKQAETLRQTKSQGLSLK